MKTISLLLVFLVNYAWVQAESSPEDQEAITKSWYGQYKGIATYASRENGRVSDQYGYPFELSITNKTHRFEETITATFHSEKEGHLGNLSRVVIDLSDHGAKASKNKITKESLSISPSLAEPIAFEAKRALGHFGEEILVGTITFYNPQMEGEPIVSIVVRFKVGLLQ